MARTASAAEIGKPVRGQLCFFGRSKKPSLAGRTRAAGFRRQLADRFEFHYTPKHGSWLDMAEIELGILGHQCLSRRIDNVDGLRREVKAWNVARNAAGTRVGSSPD